MVKFRYLIFGVLLLSLAGCSAQKSEEPQALQEPPPAEEQAAQQAAPVEPAPETQAAPPAEPARVASAPARQTTARQSAPAPAPAPRYEPAPAPAPAPPPAAVPEQRAVAEPAPAAPRAPRYAFIDQGTRLEVRLNQAVSSATNKAGDAFESTLDQDLVIDGKVVAPRGSVVMGKIATAAGSGRVEGRATMSMTLTELRVRGESYALKTNTLAFEAEGTGKEDATKIGAGAGIGALIGAIAGGKKGAAIGAAIGGGAGTATVLATKGKEVQFAAEELFSFVVREDVQIRLP